MTANAGQPVITALLITHNHEDFIAGAIESALAQQTSLPMEILICEDASTDGTAQIVSDYAGRYPDRIRALFSKQNLQSNPNVAKGLLEARGKFVALLDGDDLWLETDKLERQAKFLINNPQYSAHFFNASVLDSSGRLVGKWTPANHPAITKYADIWYGNPFATAAGMLRVQPIRHMPLWYHHLSPITDWPLYVICANSGPICFEDVSFSIYRLHTGGEFSVLSEKRKLEAMSHFYADMKRNLDRDQQPFINAGCARLFHDRARGYLDAGRPDLAWLAWSIGLQQSGHQNAVGAKQRIGLAWRILEASWRYGSRSN